MTHSRFRWTFALIYLVWIAALVPFINLLLPLSHGSDAGEFLFCIALLAYFAAPHLLVARID